MPDSIISVGDKFHIMTRRLFEEDLRRHFAGEVTSVGGSLGVNEYRRLPELRTRVFALGDAGHIVNKIPREVDLGSLGYRKIDNRLVFGDGRSFGLAINEFSASN